LTGCICGHAVRNPVYLTHLDANGSEALVVCVFCASRPFVRRLYEETFAELLEVRRAEWDGLSKQQRARAMGRVTRNWTQKKIEELKGEVG
jgi:hypothetical protein